MKNEYNIRRFIHLGKILFILGWVAFALSIGYIFSMLFTIFFPIVMVLLVFFLTIVSFGSIWLIPSIFDYIGTIIDGGISLGEEMVRVFLETSPIFNGLSIALFALSLIFLYLDRKNLKIQGLINFTIVVLIVLSIYLIIIHVGAIL